MAANGLIDSLHTLIDRQTALLAAEPVAGTEVQQLRQQLEQLVAAIAGSQRALWLLSSPSFFR